MTASVFARYEVFGTETFHFAGYQLMDLRRGQRYGRRSGSFPWEKAC